MNEEGNLTLFQSKDGAIVLPVSINENHTEAGLRRSQIAALYDR